MEMPASSSHPRRRRRRRVLGSGCALLLSALGVTASPVAAAPQTTVVTTKVFHPLRLVPPPPGFVPRLAGTQPIGYIPCDVANAYRVGASSFDGAGVVIAIITVMDQPAIASDLHSFDAAFGLPDPTLNVIQPFGTPASNVGTGWDVDVSMDVEWAHAMAPGATIDLVEVQSFGFSLPVGESSGDLTSGIFYATHTLDADIVSMSWGTLEPFMTAADEAALNGNFPSVNGAGRPIQYIAAAGRDIADIGFDRAWPALAPGVLGVGGTDLAPAAFGYAAPPPSHFDCSGIVGTPGVNSVNEIVYGNQPGQCMGSSECLGTGGGPSGFEAKPAWQSIAPGTNRVSPDVSILAAETSGVAVFMEGGWFDFGVGGLSLAAPLWAGVVARLDQARRALGQPALNTTPTASWAYSASAGDFNDITVGSAPPVPNDPCIASGACAAHVGYDAVSGRGSPIVSTLMSDFGGGVDSLGGVVTAAPAVSSWGNRRLDLFARGTDNALLHKWWDGSTWRGWESLGGVLTSGPAAVSWGPNRIDVFVRGTDDALWHRWWDGSAWQGWESLGGVLTEAPAVSSWAAGRLDVFVRGTDNGMWHKWFEGGWSGWEGHGGVLTSAPGAVSWGPGRVDAFSRAADNSLSHLWWDGSWHGPEARGGTLTSAPAAASTALNRLSVSFLGTGGILHQETWDGTSWSNSFPATGTAWQLGVAAVSRTLSGTVDVFTVGSSSAVWHGTR